METDGTIVEDSLQVSADNPTNDNKHQKWWEISISDQDIDNIIVFE